MPISTTPANLTTTFAGGELTIGAHVYSLTKLPGDESPLVTAQKTQVTANLNIADMMSDLSMSVKLIYLAYCGVAGTGDLAAGVAKRQNELLTVCSSCLTMAQTIQRKTKSAMADLLEAFTILLDENFADESEALLIFAACGEYAAAIASECRKTAQKVNALTTAIGDDATLTEKAIGVQNVAIRELQNLQQGLNATLAKQSSLAKSLKKHLETLQKDIAEAKEDERTESKRAFITGIVSAVSGAIGAGLGAFAGAYTGASTVSRATAAVAQVTKPVPRPEDDPALQASKAEVEKGKQETSATETELKTLTQEKEEKEKQLAEAEAAEKASAAEITQLGESPEANDAATRASLKAAEAKKEQAHATSGKLTKEITSLEDKITNRKAALAALAEGLKNMQATLDKRADAAQQRADKAQSLRVTLMQQKRDDEKERRQALATVKELTTKLADAATNQKVAESSLAALQIAKWALHNVYVSLEQFETFWSSMAAYCEALSENQFMKSISRRKSWTRAKKIEWFSGQEFVTSGINNLVSWQAIHTVAADYEKEAERIRGEVQKNIRQSPSIEVARQQLPLLEAEIKEELQARQQLSKEVDEELEKELALSDKK